MLLDNLASPFCTTPIRQALTLNGEVTLMRAGHFQPELGPLLRKSLEMRCARRPAAMFLSQQ